MSGFPADFAGSRLLDRPTTWESTTPFVVTRHLKLRGRRRDPREWSHGPEGWAAFVREVLAEELERRDAAGLGPFAGAEIEPIVDALGPRRLRAHEFHLSRGKSDDDGPRRPRGAFRLRFPGPVQGPIAPGHSCHFGLGFFVRVGEDARRNRGEVST